MFGEIDRDFYCTRYRDVTGKHDITGCSERLLCKGKNRWKCFCRHRKWPTPEQFQEEYGKEYPDDWAVWLWRGQVDLIPYGGGVETATYQWEIMTFNRAKWYITNTPGLVGRKIVCACTPFGKPLDDWRPAGREDGHGQE